MSSRKCRVNRTPVRAGMTLVELLVVVVILVMVTAVSAPLLKPTLETGRLREAARELNAYVAMAKARATQLGRPAGIWLERSGPGSNACFEIFLAKMPAPYAGDLEGAIAGIQETGANTNIYQVAFPPGSEMLTASEVLVKFGEEFLIKFGYRGELYRCVKRNNSGTAEFFIDARPLVSEGKTPPGGPTGSPVFHPYQIFRKPIRDASRPLQLTGGTIIDLENSGMSVDFSAVYPDPIYATGYVHGSAFGSNTVPTRGLEFSALLPNPNAPFNRPAADSDPVVIMFEPGGSVSSVMVGGQAFQNPVGIIHLLIGKFEGLERAESLPDQPNPMNWSAASVNPITYNRNITDFNNLWVSIGHRTGSVTTAENAWEVRPYPPWGGNPAPPYFLNSLRAAREFAQSGQTTGGR